MIDSPAEILAKALHNASAPYLEAMEQLRTTGGVTDSEWYRVRAILGGLKSKIDSTMHTKSNVVRISEARARKAGAL